MATCVFCGMTEADVVVEGAAYCCDGCVSRAREMEGLYQNQATAYEATLEALATALDIRERKTGEHSRRVARYAMILTHEMGVEEKHCRQICRGALLHDIGKIGVPDAILLKEGPLDEAEWAVMRRHPEMGARILEGIPFLEDAREIVLTHQERFDGSGYPAGLRGEDIPLGARIFAVADVLDALLSDRPYHRAMPFGGAVEKVRGQAGSTLDQDVVATMVRVGEQLRQVEVAPLCVGLQQYPSLHWRESGKEVSVMAKDPVCGMEVDEKAAAAQATHEGKTVVFCSPACKATFQEDPERYSEPSEKGGHGGH